MHFTSEQIAILVGLSVSIVVSFGGVVVLAIAALKTWLEGMIKKMKNEQEARDYKAAIERAAMKESLDAQDIVLEATHKEINGLRSISLRTIKNMSQRISDENPSSVGDAATATDAAEDYQKHQEHEIQAGDSPGTVSEKQGKPEP